VYCSCPQPAARSPDRGLRTADREV